MMKLPLMLACASLAGPLVLAAEQAPPADASPGNPAKKPAAESKPAKTEPVADIARFIDGDQLRGRFDGINADGSIAWRRDDFPQPAAFQTTKLRQVILRGGKAKSGMSSLCHAHLVNGDRIPGTLVELTEDQLVLDTLFAGRVSIPRNQLAAVAPNPFGGTVSYCGPFEEDGWKIIGEEEAQPTRRPAPAVGGVAPVPAPAAKGKDKDKDKEAPKAPWAFSGTAWYSGNPGPALVHETGLGDLSLIRFTVAWRNRLQFAIAFHSDFKKPDEEKEEKDKGEEEHVMRRQGTQAFPWLFGSSYVLSINSGYTMLHRCGFDDEKKPLIDRVQTGNMNVRLPESGEAVFELRCDRKAAAIFLYVDGEFASQWDESADGYVGKGSGFGFLTQGTGVRMRLSDILVAEWNGMPDSARSLDASERDVLLLVNGTDRFSGAVKSIHDEQIKISSAFAEMTVPVSKAAEIRFAKSRRAEVPESSAGQMIVHLPPLGRVAGKPLASAAGSAELDHPFLGKLKVNLDYASILDFQPGNSFLDDWDSDF